MFTVSVTAYTELVEAAGLQHVIVSVTAYTELVEAAGLQHVHSKWHYIH